MSTNTFSICQGDTKDFVSLITDCEMIQPLAKEILNNHTFAWANIFTRAFDYTVKGNSISVNTFATYIADCTFIKFLDVLKRNDIILAVEKGMLVFLGNGDIEDILIDELFTIKYVS